MKLFKSYSFTWQEVGIFKLALMLIGAIFGAYFSDFVKDYLLIIIVLAVVLSGYILYIALKQHSK